METNAGGRTDRASLEIPAEPEAVYAAFADPEKLMAWLPPGGMTGRALAYDFRPGGRYRIALTYDASAPTGVGKTASRTDVSAGRFVSLDPGRTIVQSVQFESSDAAFAGEMTITWSFERTPQGTHVTVTAKDVPAGISREDHAAGLHSSLENLARFCARR
jgi:uncharacterized protein YndB with AHSA1/START domain